MLERLLAKRHISNLELSSVRLKAMEELAWSSEKIDQVELEYRRFLFALLHKNPQDQISPPTLDVDEFWHQHILDTRKYREDCQRIFGHYVDHTPGLNTDAQARADARRRQVYAEHNIDSITFDSGGKASSGEPFSDASFFESSSGDSGGNKAHHGHDGHSGHSGYSGHSDGGHGGDGSGHSGADAGGDSGGGDGGSGCGGGDGGGGCGGS